MATNPNKKYDPKTDSAPSFAQAMLDSASLFSFNLNVDTVVFQKCVLLFAFQGFDAAKCFATLQGLKTTEGFDFFLMGVLVYAATRGTKIMNGTKAYEKSDPVAKAQLNKWQVTFGLKGDASKAGPGDLTIGRIVSLMPHLMLAVQGKFGRTITPNTKIPLAWQFPGAAALFPRDSPYDESFEDWLEWAISYDRVINQPTKEFPDRKPNPENVKKFASFARNGTWVDEQVRKKAILSFGLIQSYGKEE